MRFWWLVDIFQQNQFRIFWEPRNVNLADYFSKKRSASHHMKFRPIYLYMYEKISSFLQGCDKILAPVSMAKHRTDVWRTDVDTIIFHPGLKE